MGMKVLVAEPHAGMRAEVKAMLESLDCTVIATADDGLAAVAAFMHFGPDLAVLGVDLPGLSGVEAALSLAACGQMDLVVPNTDQVVLMPDGLLARESTEGERVRALMDRLKAANGPLH